MLSISPLRVFFDWRHWPLMLVICAQILVGLPRLVHIPPSMEPVAGSTELVTSDKAMGCCGTDNCCCSKSKSDASEASCCSLKKKSPQSAWTACKCNKSTAVVAIAEPSLPITESLWLLPIPSQEKLLAVSFSPSDLTFPVPVPPPRIS
jgi:hypothetical protein